MNVIERLQPYLLQQWQQAGFESLTAVQEKTFSYIEEGKDLIAESPTGTGKTLAYLLPILNRLDTKKTNIQVVILAPSRELVMQIFDVLQKWTTGSEVKVASFIGGANPKRQLEKLKTRPQIIVGTPGRIEELIKQKKVKMHEVNTLVFDEGDQLLMPEHLPTIGTIVKSTPKQRQSMLFSATLPKELEQDASEWMTDPVTIRINKTETIPSKVDHIYFVCEPREKILLLEKLAKMDDIKALAFVRAIGSLSVMASKLAFKDVSLGHIHGESKKQDRENAMKKFRSGEYAMLVATDIAARGLDIQGLSHVIHVDFPENLSQYVHRSGRTGRSGASGTVISLVTPREERELKKYARELGVTVQQKNLYKGQIVDARQKKPVQPSHSRSKRNDRPTSSKKSE